MTSDLAVVGHMDIGHKKIVVPDFGHPAPFRRAAVECYEFTKHIFLPMMSRDFSP
jgi:hypothetical protein